MAEAEVLLKAANDSDAVYHGLSEPRIVVHANGEYDADRRFEENVIVPFASRAFAERFVGNVANSSHYYNDENDGTVAGGQRKWADGFESAFAAEYGLVPTEAIEGLARLMKCGVARRQVIVEATLDEMQQLLTMDGGLSNEACGAFIDTFVVFRRDSWKEPPDGFGRKDLYPWRFRRRLSLLARPVLAFGNGGGDAVCFGVGTVQVAGAYVVAKARDGTLPQSFFRSAEMRAYAGAMNHRRGREFNELVAARLREAGWHTRTEVRMTEVGGGDELGDIDVLAWRRTGQVELVECKCLYLALTVGEVAEICRRFKGEANDELARHVRRVRWIENHLDGLKAVVGFTPVREMVGHRLVTNRHVPVQYTEGLPVPSGLVGPLSGLDMDA